VYKRQWSKFVQLYGLERDLLKPEVDGFNTAFITAKDRAVQKIVEKCVGEKDPSQISKLQHVYRLLIELEQIWGFEGLNPGAVLEKIKKLANFELKITEHIRMKMKEYSEDMFSYTVDGSGSVPIKVTASSERGVFWLGGEGQFQLTNALLHVNIPKDFPVTDVASGLAYGFITMMNGDHKEPMSQAYKISVPDIPLLVSGDKDVQLSFDVSPLGSEADFPWLSEIFRPFHRDVCTGHYFKLTGWNIAGKGGVFGNKVHTHTGSIEDMDLTEETTYELLFTPKAD
jgi:hypothetical protein